MNAIQSHAQNSFENAFQLASTRVPRLPPQCSAGEARQALAGQSYDCASHLVVCDDEERLLGLLRIEDLLCAAAESPLAELMDRQTPVVAPGVDQEVAAWRAVPSFAALSRPVASLMVTALLLSETGEGGGEIGKHLSEPREFCIGSGGEGFEQTESHHRLAGHPLRAGDIHTLRHDPSIGARPSRGTGPGVPVGSRRLGYGGAAEGPPRTAPRRRFETTGTPTVQVGRPGPGRPFTRT